MKTVAVLGGGPAGAFAAERLARAGLKTIVFDEKLAWEKPCGGGLTYKAYQRVSVSDRQRHSEEVGSFRRRWRAQGAGAVKTASRSIRW